MRIICDGLLYSRVFLCCYCFGCYCQFPWYFCWKKEQIPRSVSKFHEMRKSCLGTRGSLLSRKVNSCWPSNDKMGHLMSRSHLETVSSYNPQNVVVILIMAAFEAVWRDGNYQQTDLKVNVINLSRHSRSPLMGIGIDHFSYNQFMTK